MNKIQDLQLIIHVGPGLHDIAKFDGNPLNYERALQRLEHYLDSVDQALTAGQPVARSVAPEILKSPQKAIEQVLETFVYYQKVDVKVFSVALFSKDVTNPLLNAVYDLDISANTLVVLHRKSTADSDEKAYTVHGLDAEACLDDGWPYGVLDAAVDEHRLAGLGFPEALEILARRRSEKQK